MHSGKQEYSLLPFKCNLNQPQENHSFKMSLWVVNGSKLCQFSKSEYWYHPDSVILPALSKCVLQYPLDLPQINI